jgi:hypothetical protein
MLNLCSIVVAILKMATGRNFQCRESIRDITIIIIILFLFLSFFLSVDHELVHGRTQELLDRISWNLVEL